MCDLRDVEYSELAFETAKLGGHVNHKQKINLHQRIREENNRLTQENIQLRKELNKALQLSQHAVPPSSSAMPDQTGTAGLNEQPALKTVTQPSTPSTSSSSSPVSTSTPSRTDPNNIISNAAPKPSVKPATTVASTTKTRPVKSVGSTPTLSREHRLAQWKVKHSKQELVVLDTEHQHPNLSHVRASSNKRLSFTNKASKSSHIIQKRKFMARKTGTRTLPGSGAQKNKSGSMQRHALGDLRVN